MVDMAEVSSSASSSGSSNFEVFLSFRGEDTRNSFTGFLHKALKNSGINVFIDSEKLWTGEAIGPALLGAIKGSKISIPVFSKGYASSKWCLLELSEILHCHRSNGQMVLPIFFDVEPSHVRNQTGSFEGFFRRHVKIFKPHIVESWREALREVGNLKGWVLEEDANGDQAELVELVVKRVLDELSNSTHLAECKYPVGIDSHVNDLLTMLHIGSNDVQFIGVCGFGGIGKTTITRAVYNRILLSFNRHSFLSDVREQTTQCKGLASLQKRLLKDILRIDIDIGDHHMGKNLIKQRLWKEKVLLVLDDVDSQDQIDALAGELNWFGQGSRVIITTRDEHILNVAKVDKDKIYWPQELDRKESLQLFSLHAFSTDQPPEEYMQLSHDVACYSGGLPLTLEVLGSYLSDINSKEVWESTLQKLKETPHTNVQRRLKISYDNLEDDYQKAIFLDAACFFIGWEKEIVISIWEACGYYPKSAIDKLIKRSLLRFGCGFDEDGEFSKYYLKMHDQIRDMGREIVLKESPMKPGDRSRIWSHGEILEVLEDYKGTNRIKGMILPSTLSIPYLKTGSFEMMSNLRFLDINSVKLLWDDFSHLPSALRWLRWSCPWGNLPYNFYHKRLIYLNLSGSNIERFWSTINRRNEDTKFQKLKVLDLSGCTKLSESPNFSWFPNLERLNLGDCPRLKKLDESIQQLSQLKSLILSMCSLIQELPDGVGLLEKLEVLDAKNCNRLRKLPRSMGRMRCLHSINLKGTNISKIPDDFSMLSNLVELKISPRQFPVTDRPLSELVPLVELGSSTHVGCLPLDLNSSRASGSHLSEVVVAPNERHKYTFEVLDRSLESKKFFEQRHKDLLEEFEDFKRHAKYGEWDDCQIPVRREELELELKLEYLPELPSSLVELHCEGCDSLVQLPDISRLKNLRILCLEDCIMLKEVRGLEGIEFLVELNARGCYNLTDTPRKVLGQGTALLPHRTQQNRYPLSAKDGRINNKGLILCIVLEFPSNFMDDQQLEQGQLQTINLDISASICQNDKTTRCYHSLRIEDVEVPLHQDIIYIHHFKGFDWFGIPLEGKDSIEILDIRASYFVKFWKVLFDNRESKQRKPDQQYSSAMMVADFFNWSHVNGNGGVLSPIGSLTFSSPDEVEGSNYVPEEFNNGSNQTSHVPEKEIHLTIKEKKKKKRRRGLTKSRFLESFKTRLYCFGCSGRGGGRDVDSQQGS